MSGQDATLTVAQAKAQIERISANDQNHQGTRTKGKGHTEVCEKQPHQGK